MRQRKTLPKKTDNAEVVGQPSHDDSEGTIRISTEDSTWGLENCPKPYLNTWQARRRNQERLQVQSSASKNANNEHQLMAQARKRTHKQQDIMTGSQLTPVQRAFPNPFPRAGDITLPLGKASLPLLKRRERGARW